MRSTHGSAGCRSVLKFHMVVFHPYRPLRGFMAQAKVQRLGRCAHCLSLSFRCLLTTFPTVAKALSFGHNACSNFAVCCHIMLSRLTFLALKPAALSRSGREHAACRQTRKWPPLREEQRC